MGDNLEKLRFVFEIIAFHSKMRKHFVLRIIVLSSLFDNDGKLLSPTVSPTLSMVLKEKVENDLPF